MIRLMIFCLAALLSGCGGWWPFGERSGDPTARVPPGATEYLCADNKRLLVRYTPDGKAAWVIYPDREFRLDRTGGGDERFTNGTTMLSAYGEETVLEEGGARVFTQCKRNPGK